MKTDKQTLYQDVTNKVIKALEGGTKPWCCPWDRTGEVTLPINQSTGEHYRGINIPLLWMEQNDRGFSSSRWMTYRQAQAKSGQVRKGEKGTTIVFFKTLERDIGDVDATTGEAKTDRIPMLRTFTVFNLNQIDGIDSPTPAIEGGGFDPIDAAEAVLQASGVTIHEGGTRAFYRPSTDDITLPDRARFADAYNFYATALHELTHATGHKSRCDRQPYESESVKTQQAFEELVGELGSVFAMTDLGLVGEIETHADYLDSWLTLLRHDSRALFKAAAQAQRAHDWVCQTVAAARAA